MPLKVSFLPLPRRESRLKRGVSSCKTSVSSLETRVSSWETVRKNCKRLHECKLFPKINSMFTNMLVLQNGTDLIEKIKVNVVGSGVLMWNPSIPNGLVPCMPTFKPWIGPWNLPVHVHYFDSKLMWRRKCFDKLALQHVKTVNQSVFFSTYCVHVSLNPSNCHEN